MRLLNVTVFFLGMSLGITAAAVQLCDGAEITSPAEIVQLALNAKYPQYQFKVLSYSRSGIYEKKILNETLGRIHDWVSDSPPAYNLEISQPDGSKFNSQALISSEDCKAKIVLTGAITKKISQDGSDIWQTGEIDVKTCR